MYDWRVRPFWYLRPCAHAHGGCTKKPRLRSRGTPSPRACRGFGRGAGRRQGGALVEWVIVRVVGLLAAVAERVDRARAGAGAGITGLTLLEHVVQDVVQRHTQHRVGMAEVSPPAAVVPATVVTKKRKTGITGDSQRDLSAPRLWLKTNPVSLRRNRTKWRGPRGPHAAWCEATTPFSRPQAPIIPVSSPSFSRVCTVSIRTSATRE